MGRLSLISEGFGGGTRIAASLKHFNDRYAKEALNSRSVVIVMSDGYDTDPTEALTIELRRFEGACPPAGLAQPALGLEGLRAGGARYGRRARPYRLLRYCSFAGEPCRARRRVR